MSNLAKLAAGAVSFASTSAGFTSSDLTLFNSLASGSCVVATNAIGQGTNLDLLAELSIALTASAATTTTSYIGVYILPLNADGTTYGDGLASGSAQTSTPGPSFYAGVLMPRSGITAVTGSLILPRDLPRRDFKLALAPTLGSALAATAAASIQLQTSVLNLNG